MPSNGCPFRMRALGSTLASMLVLAAIGCSEGAERPASRAGEAVLYDDSGLHDRNDANKQDISGMIIQMGLAQAGFFTRPFTAVLDERTRAAIREFQRASGLEMTGAYDKETKKRLMDFGAALCKRPAAGSVKVLRQRTGRTSSSAIWALALAVTRRPRSALSVDTCLSQSRITRSNAPRELRS